MKIKVGSLTKMESLHLSRKIQIYKTRAKLASSLGKSKELSQLRSKLAIFSAQQLLGSSESEVVALDHFARIAILRGYLGLPLDSANMGNPSKEFEQLYFMFLDKYPNVSPVSLENSGWFDTGNAGFIDAILAMSKSTLAKKLNLPANKVQPEILRDAFMELMYKTKFRGAPSNMTESLNHLYTLGLKKSVDIAQDPSGSFRQGAFYLSINLAHQYRDMSEIEKNQKKLVNNLDEAGGADDIYRDYTNDGDVDSIADPTNPLQDLRDLGVKTPGYMHVPDGKMPKADAFRRRAYLGHLFTYSGKDLWNMYLSEIFVNLHSDNPSSFGGQKHSSDNVSPAMKKIVKLARTEFEFKSRKNFRLFLETDNNINKWFHFQGITPNDLTSLLADCWAEFMETQLQYTMDVDADGIAQWVTRSIYQGFRADSTYDLTDWKNLEVKSVIKVPPGGSPTSPFLSGLPDYTHKRLVRGLNGLNLSDDPKGRFVPEITIEEALEYIEGNYFKKIFKTTVIDIIQSFCYWIDDILEKALKLDGWLYKELEDGLEFGPSGLTGGAGALVEAIWELSDYAQVTNDVGIHGNKAIIRIAKRVAAKFNRINNGPK